MKGEGIWCSQLSNCSAKKTPYTSFRPASSPMGYRSRVALLQGVDPPSLRDGRILRATTAQALGGSRTHAALVQKLQMCTGSSQSARLPTAEERENSAGRAVGFCVSDNAAFPVRPRLLCARRRAAVSIVYPLGRLSFARKSQLCLVPRAWPSPGWILRRWAFTLSLVDSDFLCLTSLGSTTSPDQGPKVPW